MGEVGAMSFLREAAEKRRRERRKQLYVAVAVVVICALPYALIAAYHTALRLDPDWRFVEDIALRPTADVERPVVVRWTVPARITLVNATAEDELFVRDVVASLRDVLETSGMSVQVADNGEGNIQLFFATAAMFDRLASNFGATPHPGGTGFYLVWPGKKLDIATVVAVVGADLNRAERHAAIIHELAHSLGLRGHSAAFPESVIFSDGAQVSTSVALSPIDRKLLRLLYTRLKPTDGWRELREAYKGYWDTS